jgi:hypothetical protein
LDHHVCAQRSFTANITLNFINSSFSFAELHRAFRARDRRRARARDDASRRSSDRKMAARMMEKYFSAQ